MLIPIILIVLFRIKKKKKKCGEEKFDFNDNN